MPVTVILAALIAALLAGSPPPPPPPPPPPSLPLATVRLDVREPRLLIALPPVDLPAATPGHDTMVGLPLCHVLVPVSASLHSARVEVVDETGRVLPPDVLHHFNLSDPEHRELFLPSACTSSPRARRRRRSRSRVCSSDCRSNAASGSSPARWSPTRRREIGRAHV